MIYFLFYLSFTFKLSYNNLINIHYNRCVICGDSHGLLSNINQTYFHIRCIRFIPEAYEDNKNIIDENLRYNISIYKLHFITILAYESGDSKTPAKFARKNQTTKL